jgi:DNA-binding response OmpR family regulator
MRAREFDGERFSVVLEPKLGEGREMRLLLIEDNQRLADYLGTALQNGGFAIDHVTTTADAESALSATHYDTILLDLGLPDMDGLVWLGHQRRRQMTRPVLVLTARDSLEDLVAGLNQGADDYLRKPFELDELIARVRALLRRPGEALGVKLTAGNVMLNTSEREVSVAGEPVEFGRREIDGLELLMRRTGRVVPKSAIEDAIYSFGEDLASNAIEVLVHRIRRRLQEAGADMYIHTLRGVGYVFSDKTAGD